MKLVNQLQELIGSSISVFPDIEELHTSLQALNEVHEFRHNFAENDKFMEMRCVEISLFDLRKAMQQHLAQLDQLPPRAQPWEVTVQLKQSVRDVLATIPFLESMTADSFRERHWKQLLRLAGMDISCFVIHPMCGRS